MRTKLGRLVSAVGCLTLAFVASCATSPPDPEIVSLQARAEKGDVVAQRTLGGMYDFGEKVKRDYVQAAKWYQMAADRGDAIAQNNLASFYDSGLGVPQDLGRAVALYRKSAEQGYARAQNSLGGHYYSGSGVEKDRGEAFKWFKLAAEQGNVNAMQNLSNFYLLGVGTAPDPAESYKWAKIGAVLVEPTRDSKQKEDAQRLCTGLKKTLPADAVLEGHRRANEWLAKSANVVPAKEFLER